MNGANGTRGNAVLLVRRVYEVIRGNLNTNDSKLTKQPLAVYIGYSLSKSSWSSAEFHWIADDKRYQCLILSTSFDKSRMIYFSNYVE